MEYNLDMPGPGQSYLSYLCDELKPSVDARFRTHPEPEHTHALGSSMGGASLPACTRNSPDSSRT